MVRVVLPSILTAISSRSKNWRPKNDPQAPVHGASAWTERFVTEVADVKLPPFTLHRPSSTSAATELLHELGDDGVIYCGGTELLLVMKLGLSDFGHLVDIKRIPGLDSISVTGDILRIGAAATHRAIEMNQEIGERWPGLVMMTRQVANVRVRSVGTLGGNLAFADPASDPATFLLALDASIEIRGVDGVLRRVSVGDFHVSAYQTVLRSAELIEAILVPAPVDGTMVVHERIRFHERPAVTVTVAGTAKDGRVSDVRVSVGSVGPVPIRVAEAEAGLRDVESGSLELALKGAAEVTEAVVEPIGDLNGSVEYKRHLAGILVGRAAGRCLRQILDVSAGT
ncbi:MAG TPA: xanthine dehydrogenase family protein subunit M [Actinobacteria bacterium]|nr:xanthine dehydrogenase family protein subunit M [Actinomycetota bacterium]